MNKPKRNRVRLFAAIATAAILTPAIAVGASQLHQMYLESTGNYRREVVVSPDTTETVFDNAPKDWEAGWIPDDLHEEDMSNTIGDTRGLERYVSDDYIRWIKVVLYRLSAGQTYHNASSFVVDSQAFDTESGNHAVLLTYSRDYRYGSIAFAGTNYVAEVSLGKMTEEEAKKVLENISLIDSDIDYAYEYKEPAKDSEDTPQVTLPAETLESYAYARNINNMHMMQIGETAEYFYGQNLGVNVTVESVAVQDNFAGLKTDAIGMKANFSKYLDGNGKITATREAIKYGDGINTLNTALKSEQVRQYAIITKLKFTNNSDKPVECLNLSLSALSLDGTQLCRPVDVKQESCDDYRWSDNELISEGPHFSLSADRTLNKNNLEVLNPGDSAEVTFANLVDEDAFGNLYLRLGSVCTNNKEMMKSNVVNISELKPQ